MKRFAWTALAAGAMFAVVAACSSDIVSPPSTALPTLETIPGDENIFRAVEGRVKVCVFDGDATLQTSSVPAVAPANIETSTSLSSSGEVCSIVFVNPDAAAYSVTVTQNGPPGFYLWSLRVQSTTSGDADIFNEGFPNGGADCAEPPFVITPSYTASISGTEGVVIYFKQCTPVPEEEDDECSGLTPGYWKNWKNHYTAEQFDEILAGIDWVPGATAAAKRTNATAILGKNNPAIDRLKKFLLANQLTLALTGLPDLPNPSGGSLSGSCESLDGSGLGALIDEALDLLDNGPPYSAADVSRAQTLGTKLDQIANLGDD